jgi:beta-lactamase superfamily II metal-dependent hydrolase
VHTVTFFPLGNADSYRIDLENGRKILVDYANVANPDDKSDLRVNLASVLRADLKASNRASFDVVAFTHADEDHVTGADEFFYLNHAAKYQSDERIKINELWVPASMILESNLDDAARALRQEARHRLKEGKGIRVFSRPDALKDWLKAEGLDLDQRRHLITDAGKTVPGFTLDTDGVEFFVHSPFAKRVDADVEDRNGCSLVFQAKFVSGGQTTTMLMSADTPWDVWVDIVNVTKYHKNEERLGWDIMKLPHHCSYLSLSDEKGEDITEPVDEVKWLMDKGGDGCVVVSPSKPIPSDDEDVQPPHRQAANYYKDLVAQKDGEFIVTMEYPTKKSPAPLVIEIGASGAKPKKNALVGGAAAVHTAAPRAGDKHGR